jgi:5,10-methylenetetrahydromethanopterin reductase
MSDPTGNGRTLDPVVEDLSLYVRGGRVYDASAVLEDAVDAEQLGLRRIWLSERYDLKEAGVLLGGMAARTTRLELGTAALIPSSRNPILTAALGATFHSAFGPRLTLGLGRSMGEYISNANMSTVSFEALRDYADLFRRLWRGEEVDYDGPIGSFRGLHMADTYTGAPPQIFSVNLGGPRACRVAASPLFDGVYLQPFLTVDAVAHAVTWIREECQRIGRDFGTVRIVQPLVSAPEMSEERCRAYMHARMITYIGQPGMAEVYAKLNRWDMGPAYAVRSHEMFRGDPDRIDHRFHREDLMEVTKLVPDEWMYETCPSGTLENCVAMLQRYRDAGADEICLYGSTPRENAGLIQAWREHSATRSDAAEPAPDRGAR